MEPANSRYVLSRSDARKHLVVSEALHEGVKEFAQDYGFTLVEATAILLAGSLPSRYVYESIPVVLLDPDSIKLVEDYARKHGGLAFEEAFYQMVRRGLAKEYGLEIPEEEHKSGLGGATGRRQGS